MEIRSHTAIKHRLLGYYFSLCKNVLRSRKHPVDILYYVDLYCGDGETLDDITGEKHPAPFIKVLMEDCAKNEGLDVKFILNDLDSGRIDELKKKVQSLGCTDKVLRWDSKDANVLVGEILPLVPKNKWSIFFLDPYGYKQLRPFF